jgi:hypothetical protein
MYHEVDLPYLLVSQAICVYHFTIIGGRARLIEDDSVGTMKVEVQPVKQLFTV